MFGTEKTVPNEEVSALQRYPQREVSLQSCCFGICHAIGAFSLRHIRRLRGAAIETVPPRFVCWVESEILRVVFLSAVCALWSRMESKTAQKIACRECQTSAGSSELGNLFHWPPCPCKLRIHVCLFSPIDGVCRR